MKVAVLIPFRPGSGHDQNVSMSAAQWRNWRVYCADSDGELFSRSQAINRAAAKAGDADVYVVHDSDILLANPQQAVDASLVALSEDSYVVCFSRLKVLDWDATRAVHAGASVTEQPVLERIDRIWGNCFAISRSLFERAGGFDERFCVDEETEILTDQGWKDYRDLHVGNRALTLNHETGFSEWQNVQAVNVFDGKHEMLSIESKTHSSLTTLNHRWPVTRRPDYREKTGWGSRKETRGWRTSENIKTVDLVPIAADCAELPLEPIYSDAFVEMVAWFWTEGSITRKRDGSLGRGVLIHQSRKANPDKCQSIIEACHLAFGSADEAFPRRGKSATADRPRWLIRHDRHNLVVSLNAEAGDLLQHVAPKRVPTLPFILSLTKSQLDLFIETSMAGDGHRRPNSYKWTIGQKNRNAIDSFQFACILAGHATSISQEPVMDGYGYGMTTLRIREQRRFKLCKGTHLRGTIEGIVWCPTTRNGTWLARRHGKVYFTGNSGWGCEDGAFLSACSNFGSKHRVLGDAFHLRHPEPVKDHQHLTENHALAGRYARAAGNVEEMLALIGER